MNRSNIIVCHYLPVLDNIQCNPFSRFNYFQQSTLHSTFNKMINIQIHAILFLFTKIVFLFFFYHVMDNCLIQPLLLFLKSVRLCFIGFHNTLSSLLLSLTSSQSLHTKSTLQNKTKY